MSAVAVLGMPFSHSAGPLHNNRLQESRKWRKFYDDQRRGDWEDPPAAAHAAPNNEAPPALLNLHDEIIIGSDNNEPQPKKLRIGKTLRPATSKCSMHGRFRMHDFFCECMHGLYGCIDLG